MRGLHRTAVLAPLVAILFALAAAAPTSAAPSPGAAGIGDRLFPGLGNGGYDVRRYHLDLRYATSDPTQPIDGSVTIVARATQSLSRFNLDFAGLRVGDVSVNRRPAAWRREGEELVVTPASPLRDGRIFAVRADFTVVPTAPDPEDDISLALFSTPDGTATAPQPNLAHYIFPSNDHPRDKASYTIRLDVPAGTLAVANGVLIGRHTRAGRTVSTYVQRQPMATELIQLAVGRYDYFPRGRHSGVFVRDVISPTLTPLVEPLLVRTSGHLAWIQPRVGSFPFDLYGSLVVDAELTYVLETQTISLFDRNWFTLYGEGSWDPTMLHELAHEWFGNSVSPWEWSDLWLNEGHASWYEFLYAEEKGFLEEDTEDYPNPTGYADFDDLMRAVYALGDQWRAESGPVARPASADTLFSLNAYHGGALVLYALRQEIGEPAFQRLERAWLNRYRGRSASTADFIALASRIAGRDLTAFLEDWLYGTETPPMPGHPDWTVDPVEQPAPALQSLQAGGRLQQRP
jgi:aminopeptidase N